jgi:hypothetical protein
MSAAIRSGAVALKYLELVVEPELFHGQMTRSERDVDRW